MISKVDYKVPYAISSDLSFKWFSDILAKHSNVKVDMKKLVESKPNFVACYRVMQALSYVIKNDGIKDNIDFISILKAVGPNPSIAKIREALQSRPVAVNPAEVDTRRPADVATPAPVVKAPQTEAEAEINKRMEYLDKMRLRWATRRGENSDEVKRVDNEKKILSYILNKPELMESLSKNDVVDFYSHVSNIADLSERENIWENIQQDPKKAIKNALFSYRTDFSSAGRIYFSRRRF